MKTEAFNKALGAVIRKERLLRGWSMNMIGDKLGVSYQQIAKYEHGENGCSAHMLTCVAAVLQVSVVDLLKKARVSDGGGTRQSPAEDDAILAARYVAKIPSQALRRNIIDFARKSAYEEARS